MKEMKALTIWQPWASAIALGFKRYETRVWPTRYRGPILIHAAARWSGRIARIQLNLANDLKAVAGSGHPAVRGLREKLPLGAIVALADLVDCEPISGHRVLSSRSEEDAIERVLDFAAGRYAWQLENVIAIDPPIETRGYCGLWTPPAELVDKAAASMRSGTGRG